MGAVLKLPEFQTTQPQVAAETRAMINRLRFYAALCRCSAHLDIYSACAAIGPTADEELVVPILIRVLPQAVGRPVTWLRPNEDELSFDERWLAQAIACKQAGDTDSLAFLLHSRVARSKQRIVAMLIGHLARTLK
ncbi:MAG: hypothetical protein ACU0DW_09485 [Shimia sp.]